MEPLDRMEKVRKGLKKRDTLAMPEGDEFFERLHDKIMAEVEKTEVAPAPFLGKSRNLLRAHWRGWLYPTSGVAALAVVSFLAVNQVSKVNQAMQRAGLASDGTERIVAEALLSPEAASQTLISMQSESDFFMDVASESFENLTVAKFKKIMGESGR
ncbi:MAG: anti-sigma factor [Bdellovibrio sp.]